MSGIIIINTEFTTQARTPSSRGRKLDRLGTKKSWKAISTLSLSVTSSFIHHRVTQRIYKLLEIAEHLFVELINKRTLPNDREGFLKYE